MIDHETQFFKYLKIIAEITKYQLTDELLELYDLELSVIGYETANIALKKIARAGGIKGRFPNIDEIENLVCGRDVDSSPADSDESNAVVAVSAIMRAISSHGWVNGNDEDAFKKMQAIRKDVGELGWSIIEAFNGWNEICKQVTYDNMATKFAQFRESGRALAFQHRQGLPYPSPLKSLGKPASELPGQSSRFSVQAFTRSYFEPREPTPRIH